MYISGSMKPFQIFLLGFFLLGKNALIFNSNIVSAFSTIAANQILSTGHFSSPSHNNFIFKRSLRAETHPGPYLDGKEITNVTTQLGIHAFLPCKIKQSGNKSVSWIRVRDDHILSVDRVTFIADDRFQPFFIESDGIWTLQIKYVQQRDEGLYECQVSTEPKVSARVYLKVIVPKTEIVGQTERYVKVGSTVILRCVVRGALEPPSYIMWYHADKQIAPETRGGWRIDIEKGLAGSNDDNHSTIGSLFITSVKRNDAGNYTCKPSHSGPVTISLQIINGKIWVSDW